MNKRDLKLFASMSFEGLKNFQQGLIFSILLLGLVWSFPFVESLSNGTLLQEKNLPISTKTFAIIVTSILVLVYLVIYVLYIISIYKIVKEGKCYRDLREDLNTFIWGCSGSGKTTYVRNNLYSKFFRVSRVVIAIVYDKDRFLNDFEPFYDTKITTISLKDFIDNNAIIEKPQETLIVIDIEKDLLYKEKSENEVFLKNLLNEKLTKYDTLLFIDEPNCLNQHENLLNEIISKYKLKVVCSQSIINSESYLKSNFHNVLVGKQINIPKYSSLNLGEFVPIIS